MKEYYVSDTSIDENDNLCLAFNGSIFDANERFQSSISSADTDATIKHLNSYDTIHAEHAHSGIYIIDGAAWVNSLCGDSIEELAKKVQAALESYNAEKLPQSNTLKSIFPKHK